MDKWVGGQIDINIIYINMWVDCSDGGIYNYPFYHKDTSFGKNKRTAQNGQC